MFEDCTQFEVRKNSPMRGVDVYVVCDADHPAIRFAPRAPHALTDQCLNPRYPAPAPTYIAEITIYPNRYKQTLRRRLRNWLYRDGPTTKWVDTDLDAIGAAMATKYGLGWEVVVTDPNKP